MRRICAVTLIIVLGSLLGRVSGQSAESTTEPLITQEAPQDALSTPEIIPTTETAAPEATDIPSPTDSPTLIPSETPSPLPTEQATAEIVASPSQDVVTVTDEASAPSPTSESLAWELSVRELFEDAPETPWLIPSGWTLDANQRLAALADQAAPLPVIRYESAISDIQTQAAFFLSEGATASLAVRVTENGAYTAELDASGAARLLRGSDIVAQNALSLPPAESHILNVMAVGGTVTVRVDDQLVVTYTDPSPLPAGAVELGGRMATNGFFALDDIFIWRLKLSTPDPILPPIVMPDPVLMTEPTAESLPNPAEGEVVAQAEQLIVGTATSYSPQAINEQKNWEYTLPAGGNTSYYIEIKRITGSGWLNLYVLTDVGYTDKIAFGAPDGHTIIWLSHATGGLKKLLTAGGEVAPSTTFEIKVHACCKPTLIADVEETFDKYVSAGYIYHNPVYNPSAAGIAHWAYELTTPTVHFLDWFRTTGNLSYRYTIRYRSTGAIVSQGNVLADLDYPETAMYVPSTSVGWYDVELTLLKDIPATFNNWTQGTYELGLFYGNPFPPAPTNFAVQERGISTLSFDWDADPTGKTEYFALLRRPSIGAEDYILRDFIEGDTQIASESDLLCNTTYEYRLMAYNWAAPSTDDGDTDATDIEEEDLYSAPIIVSTLGCPPANDVRPNSQALTTFPANYDYLPPAEAISSAENDEGDPLLSCAEEGYTSSIWFRYNPAAATILKVTTANSTYDTAVGIYQNVNGQLVERACHDDIENFVNTTSQVIYETAPNQQYFIMVVYGGTTSIETTDAAHVQLSLLERPAAPMLISPVNKGATQEELTWSEVPGAVKYHLQISATSTFANRLTDDYLPQVFESTISDTIADGIYFWHVRAVTEDGITGPWSTTWSFTKDTADPPAPTITVPAANAVFSTLRPSFKAAVPVAAGATRYEWEFATDENFTSLVPTIPTSSLTSVLALTQSLPQGQYFAHTRACDAADNCGPFTDPRPFQIDLRLLPANNAPVIAANTTSAVAFKWALPQGVTGFTLQISTDAAFTGDHVYTKAFTVPAPPAAPPLTWSIANVGQVLGLGQFYWRLVLTNPNLPDATTILRRFIVTPPLPAAPKWIAQPNAGILKTKTPEFKWQPVAYAYLGTTYNVTYEVQVDNLATFASPEYSSTAPISGVTHTTTDLPDGIYYARVRTVNEFGAAGGWSLSQRVIIDTALPLAPIITTPYLNAPSSLSRQPVTWKAVSGATHYRLQYSRTPTFDDVVIKVPEIKAPVLPATPAYTPTVSLPQGQYFVRVAARDAALNWGNYSETAYTLAVNTLPANNGNLIPTPATATTIRPLFKWAAVPGATQYQVVVASDDTCATEIARSPILGARVLAWSYTIDANGVALAPLGYGAYYWCVAINRGGGAAPLYTNTLEMPSQGFRLNIVPTVPPAVSIVYPTIGLPVSASQPTIFWADMPAAVPNGPFKFEVQIDDNPLFNDREFEGITGFGDFSITPDTLQDGKYNLRIRAINSVGGVGLWSVARPFSIDTDDPDTPTLLTPAQDSAFNGTLPTITWTPVSDATAYLVQISHAQSFSPRYEWTVKTTSSVVPFALLNQTYFVRVKAIDTADNRSPFTTPLRVFRVNWPAAQAPIPVYYRLNEPTDVITLSWEPVAWASRYEVQISGNTTFTQIVRSTIKGNMLLPEDSVYELPPTVDGVYYWRVRAGTGTQWFAWSDVITFAVDS